KMKRDVDDHARSGERTRHARPGEPSCPHDVAADVERGQELVDRLRDPACGYDGAQRRSLDGCQHSVPAEGARPDRHEVKERHPEETHPGRGEGPRDLADTQIEEERGEERGPTGQSDVHQGDEPRGIGAAGRRWLLPRRYRRHRGSFRHATAAAESLTRGVAPAVPVLTVARTLDAGVEPELTERIDVQTVPALG